MPRDMLSLVGPGQAPHADPRGEAEWNTSPYPISALHGSA